MSLNLGDITFGITAQTDGMQKAQDALNAFGAQVTAVAKSQVEGAAQAAAALNKQEKAARDAFIQTTELQAALRSAGASPQLLGQATASFNNLNKAMTSGQLNVVDYTRAQAKFQIQIGAVQAALAALEAEEVAGAGKGFSTVLKDLQSSATLALGPLSGVGSRISALGSIAGRSTASFAAMAAGFIATSVAGYALTAGAISADKEMQRITTTFTTATGSSMLAAQAFDYVSAISRTLGLNINDTAEDFAKFATAAQGTQYGGQQLQTVFTAVMEASVALGMSTEQTANTLNAFERMMQRGVVTSREMTALVSGGLKDAYTLAAEAMGVTTDQLNAMLKTGNLMTSSMLPKLAALMQQTFSGQATQASTNFTNSMNRLHDAMFDFENSFNSATGAMDKFTGLINGITSFLEWMAQNMPNIVQGVWALAGAVTGLAAAWAVVNFETIVAGLTGVWTGVKTLTTALLAMEGVAAAVTGGLTLITGAIIGGAVAWSNHNAALAKSLKAQIDYTNQTSQFIDQQNKSATATKANVQALIDNAQAHLIAAEAQETDLENTIANRGVMSTIWNSWTEDQKTSLQTQADVQHQMVATLKSTIAQMQSILTNAPKQTASNTGSPLLKDKSVQQANKMLDETQAKLAALRGGPQAMEDYDLFKTEVDQMNQYRNALVAAGYSQDTINSKMKDFTALLPQVAQAQKEYNDITKPLTDASHEWIEGVVGDLMGLQNKTVTFTQFWDNMINNMVAAMEKFVLEQAIVRPITNALGGLAASLAPGLASAFGITTPALDITSGNVMPSGASFTGGSAVTFGSSTSQLLTMPGRAGGGNMTANQPYRVFDGASDQVEVFIPSGSGNMVANASIGGDGGGFQLIINNNNGSQVSAKRNNNGNVQVDIEQALATSIRTPGTRLNGATRNAVSQGTIGR